MGCDPKSWPRSAGANAAYKGGQNALMMPPLPSAGFGKPGEKGLGAFCPCPDDDGGKQPGSEPRLPAEPPPASSSPSPGDPTATAPAPLTSHVQLLVEAGMKQRLIFSLCLFKESHQTYQPFHKYKLEDRK